MVKWASLVSKTASWSWALYAMFALVMSLYILFIVGSIWSFVSQIEIRQSGQAVQSLLYGTLLILISSTLASLTALCFFYLNFLKSPLFLRLRINQFLLVWVRVPHILLGSFFIVWVPDGRVAILGVLYIFILPRLYQFCSSHLYTLDENDLESARSLNMSPTQIFYDLILWPQRMRLLGRIALLSVQAFCLLAPFLCFIPLFDQLDWPTLGVFTSWHDASRSQQVSTLVILFLLYTAAFFYDRGALAKDWRYG